MCSAQWPQTHEFNSNTKIQSARFMGNPCFCQWASKVAPLCRLWPCFSLPTKYCSTKRACVRLYVRVRRLKPIQALRTHARTRARARTHITEVSLVGPRLALSPEVGVCVLCLSERQKRGTIFRQTPLRGTWTPTGSKVGHMWPPFTTAGLF